MNIALGPILVFLLSISGSSSAEVSEEQIEREYEEGYTIGVMEANAEIKSNKMTYYTCGLVIPPAPGEGPRERYGLPIKHVCGVMDSKMSGIIHGHNEAIKEYLGVAQ